MDLSGLAPRAGFEPATLRLTAGCSAVELPRNAAGRTRRMWTYHGARTNLYRKPNGVIAAIPLAEAMTPVIPHRPAGSYARGHARRLSRIGVPPRPRGHDLGRRHGHIRGRRHAVLPQPGSQGPRGLSAVVRRTLPHTVLGLSCDSRRNRVP